MGCCQSSDRSEYDSDGPALNAEPANVGARHHDASCAAINEPSRSLSNVDSPRRSSSLASRNARPNQPIRSPSPLPTSPVHLPNQPPPWTRSQLEREREAFFDTRVSGKDEVWKAIRVICEELRKNDTAEAQGILDAMGMTCPNGRVVRGRGRSREKGGLYDERGELYDMPAWIVTDPEDLVEDEEKDGVEKAVDNDEDDEAVGDPAAVAEQREEKGKGRAEDPGEIVQVRSRMSNTGTDITVSAGTKQKVAVVVRSIQERIGQKRLRLMYLGKTLDERMTLAETGWRPGNVINAMVFEGDENMLSKKSTK